MKISNIKTQKLASVIGWPIQHSLSPVLHGYWLEKYGIDGAYIKLAVSPENLESALRILPKLGFAGTNITTPHKEKALSIVDHIEPFAKRVGAINTIFINEDGSLTGTNTDGFGFIENLRTSFRGWNISKLPVVVLGAGGASRAIVASLVDEGVSEVRLVNRTTSKAKELSDAIGGPISVHNWNQANDCLCGASLMVNTTTLGMHGTLPVNLDLSVLADNAVVTDIVYSPLTTPVLRQAKALQLRTVDGLGMLLHQAVLGFENWFGRKPFVTKELRNYILSKITEQER